MRNITIVFVATTVSCVLSPILAVRAQTSAVSTLMPVVRKIAPAEFNSKFSYLKRGKLVKSLWTEIGRAKRSFWILWLEKESSELRLLETTLLVVELVNEPGKKWRLRRIVPLGDTREEKISFHWLRPSEKSGPVLVRESIITQGLDVIAFPDGWEQKKAVRQFLESWTNPIQTGHFVIDGVDEAGFLRFKQDVDNWGEGYQEDAGYSHYVWNGKGWIKGEYHSEK